MIEKPSRKHAFRLFCFPHCGNPSGGLRVRFSLAVILVCLYLVHVSAHVSGLDLTLVPKGDLMDLIRERLKDGSRESYKEAVLYLKEIELRGSVLKDWDEYRTKQALAQCYNAIGEAGQSYAYWTEVSNLDTAKYFGDRPKHVLVGLDVLYNRIVLYQKAAFGSANKTSADTLLHYLKMINTLSAASPKSPDVVNLLFNKSLFLLESGNSKDGEATIEKIRKEFPEFQYLSRLDSLECKFNRSKCKQEKKKKELRE